MDGSPAIDSKDCPDCAEQVKAAARKCRHCGYRFDQEVAQGEEGDTLPDSVFATSASPVAEGSTTLPSSMLEGSSAIWQATAPDSDKLREQLTRRERKSFVWIGVGVWFGIMFAFSALFGGLLPAVWNYEPPPWTMLPMNALAIGAAVYAALWAYRWFPVHYERKHGRAYLTDLARQRADSLLNKTRQDAMRGLSIHAVGGYRGVVLYPDRIQTSEGMRPLTPDVKADVDTAGNISVTRRHTLTRFLAVGMLSVFAPKATRHDDRELYLLIEADEWAAAEKCKPNDGQRVRALAQQINLAARSSASNGAAIQSQVEAARQHIDAYEKVLRDAVSEIEGSTGK